MASDFVQWPSTAAASADPGRTSVSGSLDEVAFDFGRGWVARGWAVAYDDPDHPIEVEIVEGESVVGSGIAAQFREDLQQAGIGSGNAGFAIDLSPDVANVAQHVFALRLAGSTTVIVPPQPIELGRFVGHLDGRDGQVIVGWACDAARLGVPVVVEISVDGSFTSQIVADQFRRDLAELGLGSAYFGFEWVLPPLLADGQPHRIEARIANTETILASGLDEVLLLPEDLGAETRRLLEQYREATERLATVAQSLRASARRPPVAKTPTIADLLLDSLEPPPLFEPAGKRADPQN